MKPTLLFHPQHGNKHAYLEAELEADKLNGWTVVPDEPPAETQEPPRRGRPPKDRQ